MATRGPNRRRRRIRLALVLTVVGLLLLVGAGLWVETRRDTDRQEIGDTVTDRSTETIPEAAPTLRFEDVAAAMGITFRHGPGPRDRTLPEDTGSGLAWGDVDGDGDFDLYLVNFPGTPNESWADGTREAAWNRLYRNDGGSFTDITAAAGTADPEGFGMGASFADFDDDGDEDLYVTNRGPNRLFRNLGDGTFEEVAEVLGVADPSWSVAAAWGDFDRDGRLDLYVTNYVDFLTEVRDFGVEDDAWEGIPFSLNPNAFDPQPNRLYRQLPGGAFEEIALAAGAADPEGRSLGVTVVDLDGDGWLDLYVTNDVSPNALLRNLGGELGEALFEDISTRTGTADPRGSMGISVADLGGGEAGEPDGLPDLFITHWVAQENALYQALRTPRGRLEYRDKTRQRGLGEISTQRVGWGSAFVDLDLDGRLDLVVANGSTLEDGATPPRLVPQPLFLFWDDGERFHDLAPHVGDGMESMVGRGLAAADYDADGDVDLAIMVNRGRPVLLRNDTPTDGGRLAVRLEGPAAVRFGARLELSTGTEHQIRWWGADASFASNHAPEVIFGLGSTDDPWELRVFWIDGEVSTMPGLTSGRRVVAEHPGDLGL